MLVLTTRFAEGPPIKVAVSLRFELFYALHQALQARESGGGAWPTALARAAVTAPVRDAHRGFGGAPMIWILVNDALGDLPLEGDFAGLTAGLEALDAGRLAERLLTGLLHSAGLAREVIGGGKTLAQAVEASPRAKREWLAYAGLYPFRAEAPIARAVAAIRGDPAAAKARILGALNGFWAGGFQDLWSALSGRYGELRADLAAMRDRLSPARLFDELALPAELDRGAGRLRARRGGYRLALAETSEIVLFPSAFNGWRFWTVQERDSGASAYFPVFDQRLQDALGADLAPDRQGEPRLDLLFKALGKDIRLAILDLLAERPRSAGELAAELGIAKSTLSHHLFLLREADLLERRRGAGKTRLALRLAPLESLTRQSLARFSPAGQAGLHGLKPG